jgi:PTH1 family peptidyl-tRNA hydrolase
MYLVVGLGNPGRQYEDNRHNVGAMAVDAIARAVGASFKSKFSGEFAMAGELAFLKPTTFMNLSGESVQPAAAFLKVPLDRLIVIHDELDVPFADVRIKLGGGHAGHNGLRSIIARLGSPEFARVRVGIGRPPPDFKGDVASYVLSNFSSEERKQLDDLVGRAADAARLIVEHGTLEAMNRANRKG